MAFLAPLFLALGALAGVPLLVHLLRRRVGRVVDFPAVRYLLRMEKEHSRERKMKNLILLLLRMLACIALGLSAAKPIARLAGVGHSPVAVAIVLDNSMSSGLVVGTEPVLEALKKDARDLIAALAPEDRAWIVTADGKVTGGTPEALRDALGAIRPLGGRGDTRAAIGRAVALVRGGAPRAPVVAVLTDGQVNALGAATDSAVLSGNVPVLVHAPTRAVSRNRGVLDVVPEPQRWTPTGNVSASVLSADTIPWRIVLNGRTLARGTAPPGDFARPAAVSARLSSATQGWLRGAFELDADELRADDARYFAVRVAPPPSVDVRNEAGLFVAAALGTLIDDGRIARLGSANAGGLSSQGIARVVVSGAESGGLGAPILLLAPSDPLRVGDANRTLERLNIPWRFGAVARDTVMARTNSQLAHSAADSALEGAKVMQRYPLLPTTASAAGTASAGGNRTDTLATAGNAPWAVAGAGYVLIASPMVPTATDLPLRPAFVPWLFGVVAMRLGDDGQLINATPGARITLPANITAFEMPDGSVNAAAARTGFAPTEPGVYLLRRDAAQTGALVVNAERDESNLAAATDKDLLARISGDEVSAAPNASEWRSEILDQTAGRSLAWPLIAIALLALVIESWLSRMSATAVHTINASAKSATRTRAA
ncbi:MAG: BatA domain-containing protein [Phycisphaerae bacterium]|nr:BatA domain-containing protein [Gemmatimonadaceae bacterium]